MGKTVGIQEPVQEIIKLLDSESQKKAVAVILHGFGGMGKTTLAEAVYSNVQIERCKYSTVTLFEKIGSTPNIVELQKSIFRDLRNGTEEEKPMSEITTFKDGRQAIGEILKKEVALIYIDNVFRYPQTSGIAPLEMLLPWDMMKEARKLRVLITARSKYVARECKTEAVEFYPIKCLPSTEAMNLLKQ